MTRCTALLPPPLLLLLLTVCRSAQQIGLPFARYPAAYLPEQMFTKFIQTMATFGRYMTGPGPTARAPEQVNE